MKMIALLTAAYIGGVLRHPHEGAVPVSDEEAARLVADSVGEDVTDGFTAEQLAEVTPEAVTVASGTEPTPRAANPHLAEVAPASQAAAEPVTKPARKGGNSKE